MRAILVYMLILIGTFILIYIINGSLAYLINGTDFFVFNPEKIFLRAVISILIATNIYVKWVMK